MSEKNAFFAAPNLDEEESPIIPNKKTDAGKQNDSDFELKEPNPFFAVRDLDGNTISINAHNDTAHNSEIAPKEPNKIHRKPDRKTSYSSGENANYPWFERREFVDTQLRKEPYVIEKLPEIGAVPSINWIQVLAAPVAMLMIAFILMAAGMSNMFMMLPMQLVGVVTAIISYCSQKQKYKKSSKSRRSEERR